MKRVNIQQDVESRQRIAAASPKVFPTEQVTESVNPEIVQQNGKTTEVPGTRITQSPQPSLSPRRKEDGRPRGRTKSIGLKETRLGFLLKYEAPASSALFLT